YLELHRVDDNKREALISQCSPIPRRHHRIERLAQLRHRRLGEACPAKLLGDPADLARGDAVDHHLHEGQDERLLTALVPVKQLRGERAASDPGYTQFQRADTSLHLPLTIAIAIPRPFVRALKGRRFDVLTHLGLKHLVEYAFQQLTHAFVSTKKLMQHLAIYGNLVLGHPLHPPVVLSSQL